MPSMDKILIVDDEPSMLSYLRTVLEFDSYAVDTASSGPAAIQRVREGASPDLVLLDVLMPGLDGLETLRQLRQLNPRIKVVMLSCVTETSKVVHAMRLGAEDYLAKPFQKSDLEAVLNRALGLRPAEDAPDPAGEIFELPGDNFFACASPEMRRLRSQAALVAKVDIPVLLLGESGTGKEVLAHLIHQLSPRAHRTFLKVNCAAVPADLLESELFGYEPGAFTGATKPKPGKFELCNGGTILLDEIGEMPPPLQAKMLHVLQDQQFSRLGGRSMVRVDVRILAATNVDVKEAIAARRLREDLYYRLNGFSLRLPALRERKEEIPFFLRQFMARLAEKYARPALPLSPRLLQACTLYDWPGNLRELENFVKRYLVLADEDAVLLELESRPESRQRHPGEEAESKGLKSLVRSIRDDAEVAVIVDALEKTGWNRKRAARLLQISYKSLLYKVHRYQLVPPARNQEVKRAGAGV